MLRPATQNRRDARKIRLILDDIYTLTCKAWELVMQIEAREKDQHASTGRTDKSQVKRRKLKVSRHG